jgi:hypothetical protein
MKKSIALAIAILALGAVPGLFQQKRLTALREDHRKLAAEAGKLGLSIDPSPSSSEPRLTKRQREDSEKRARSITAEVIAFAREMEAIEKSGGKTDEAFQKRAMEMMSRLMDLDASQLKQVIAGLRDSDEISDATRGNIIAFSIMTLANDHPEAAVALYAESSDMLDKSMLGDHVISSALSRWAKLNPSAALDWVRKNSEEHPDLTGDEAKRGMITGIASNDPKFAFKLIGDLEVEDPMSAIHAIVMTGHDNPERRAEVLAALRGHLAGIRDESEREEVGSKALEVFARTADKEGFESLTSWMAESKFTPQEKEQFAGGLTYFTTKQDTGRWVEWMAGNLSADDLPDPVREIVGEWTQQDYVAAGKWLSTAADGPAKTAAVESYAEAVAEYEPQIAAQWAMTLPPGPGRDSTLRTVYQNWPASDPEGAAAFAREHGLE